MHKIYLSNIDLDLRDEIKKLITLDQYYINKINSARFIKHLIINPIWTKKDNELIEQQLIPIIKKYGYPGEKLIGIKSGWISPYLESKHGLNQIQQFKESKARLMPRESLVILVHWYNNGAHETYNDLLLEQVKNGNMPASDYASVIDFQSKYHKKRKPTYYNQWHRNVDELEREAINQRRLAIGLATYEDLRKKETRNWKLRKEIEKGNYEHIKLWGTFGNY